MKDLLFSLLFINKFSMHHTDFITAINRNFVIRYKFDEDKKPSLIGAGKYLNLLDKAKNPEEMALKHFLKAINCKENKL